MPRRLAVPDSARHQQRAGLWVSAGGSGPRTQRRSPRPLRLPPRGALRVAAGADWRVDLSLLPRFWLLPALRVRCGGEGRVLARAWVWRRELLAAGAGRWALRARAC